MIVRQQIINTVRVRLSDSSNTTFDAADMSTLLDDAVKEYSRHRPIIKHAVIDINPLDDTYDSPDQNIIEIIEARYQTFFDATYFDIEMLPPEYFAAKDRVTEMLDTYEQAALINHPIIENTWNPTLGVFELKVTPIPTVNINAIVTYSIGHSIDSSGNYPSIPTTDAEIIVDLMLAEAMKSIALDMEKRGSQQTGDARIDFTISARSIRQAANEVYNRALNGLEGGVAGLIW